MLLVAGKNPMLTHLSTLATHIALLNGSGVEISGGDYVRQSVTWGTASNGSISITNQPVFDVPAGSTVAQIAFYSASTGGTKYSESSVTSETYAGDGTYTVTSASINLNQA